MPAIDPDQLALQITQLAEIISGPDEFIQLFHIMLEKAGQESLKSSVSLTPRLIPSFKPPEMYVLHIYRGLREEIDNLSEEALKLISSLWLDEFYESKQLATLFAGHLSVQYPEEILEISESWLINNRDIELSGLITENSYSSLADKHPDRLIGKVNTWIKSRNSRLKRAGIRILVGLVKSEKDYLIPDVLACTSLLFHSKSTNIKNEVNILLSVLGAISPLETANFLYRTLDQATPIWVRSGVRKSLGSYPPSISIRLVNLLRNLDKPPI